MDHHQGNRESRPAPATPGRIILLHWAIFLTLMTALIGGAAVLF